MFIIYIYMVVFICCQSMDVPRSTWSYLSFRLMNSMLFIHEFILQKLSIMSYLFTSQQPSLRGYIAENLLC